MLLDDYVIGFKKYALYEKEINPRTTQDIINSVKGLFDYAKLNSLKEFNTATIRAYLYEQKVKKLWAARTFRNQRQYLKTFFSYCMNHDFIGKNPVDRIEKPRLPKTLPRFLTKEQTVSILAHTEYYSWRYTLEKYRSKAIITTFLFTGMRLNELRNLKIEDVNMVDNEIIVKKGKGRKERMIPIHPNLKPVLQSYLHKKKKINIISPWFFNSLRSAERVSEKTVQRVCKKISQASGVKFTAHMLRHTYARNCISNGIGLYQTKELLGHASVATTEIYLSISKEKLKKAFCEATLI